MNHKIALFCVLTVSLFAANFAHAESVPDWVKNTAKFWTEGKITDTEFLNAIKFLIEKNIIQVEAKPAVKPASNVANVVIPNGNAEAGNAGFYIPLNLQVISGTTVVWINDDNIPHTVQSQDEKGNVLSLFNSKALKTGERFAYKFSEPGVYHYFCTIHPWRVGLVTVY
ncbi:cupredoxin domain-containing protein [Candidatus Nitrosotenuis aquarius]|uniref:cupredoxin domain-containing protein n=1 Tax=Candidatus Nitrosotenuis aquarius TaxID=1846278 RepID=UPI000C1EF3A9|nr:plastocyanin/azurin family copper-binding protein [Candidatus Nitrosotenuis aquarius]